MERNHIILTTIILTTVNMADKMNNSVLNKGVIFVNQGNFLLTTSHWTLVVDIPFDEFDSQLSQLKEHLQNLRQLIKAAQRKDVENTALLGSLWNYTAIEAKNLDRMLKEQDVEYRDLKSLVTLDIDSRKKRALIDLGGDLLKFLFGTATSKEVEDLNARIARIKTNQEKIVHILEAQTTVLNETLIAVKENRQRIKMLIQGQEHLIKTVHTYNYSFFFGTVLRNMEVAIAEFRSQITSLRAAIEVLEQGRLSSYFVPRRTLYNALVDINNHLPIDITLIEPLRRDNLFKYYQLISVTAIALPNTLRLFVDIPLMNPERFFDLFEVIGFPVYYSEISMFVYYRTEYNFIALSKNRQAYMLLNTYEVLKCRTRTISICSPETAIWQSPYQSCEYALFLGLDATVVQLCDKRLVPTHPPVFRRLDQVGTWIYSTAKPLSLECSQLSTSAMQPQIVKLMGTDILNLPNSCTGHLPGIKLTAHFQQRSTLKLITKTHLVFPLVVDILNQTEIELIRKYNNYTQKGNSIDWSSTDASLNVAGKTLLDIRSKVKELRETLSAESEKLPRDYFREITSGTFSLLVVAIILVIIFLFRGRLRIWCTRQKRKNNVEQSVEQCGSGVSERYPKSEGRLEAMELTESSANKLSSTETVEGKNKLYPDIHITEETPLRI